LGGSGTGYWEGDAPPGAKERGNPMDEQDRSGENTAAAEAAQNVVDEVTSWEYSAERGTIEERLDEGLAEAGIAVDGAERGRLVDAVDALKHDEDGGTPEVDPEHVTGPRDA
jgi:hypothetical protein